MEKINNRSRRTGFGVLGLCVVASVVALSLMSVVRVVFYFSQHTALAGETTAVWPAFVRGVWFDAVVMCYVLIVPLAVGATCWALGYERRWTARAVAWWMGACYGLVLMACVANIPYFDYFRRTLNNSIWQWFAYPEQTLGMVTGEGTWVKWIAFYVLLLLAYVLLLWWMVRKTKVAVPYVRPERKVMLLRAFVSAGLIGLCIFGMRGRTGYNPIKISAAYYCNNPLLNQLGLNPAFCLLRTTLDALRPENRALHLTDEARAVADVKRWLHRPGISGGSPIGVRVAGADSIKKLNVVVVLMESMSANLLSRHGGRGLTPFLDSLSSTSLYFSNCYSAGNHTNQGIVGALYGFPAILKRNAMKGSNVPLYAGLPTVLQAAGYQTMFFMTHESQYDNMNAFLRTNGFASIYAQEDYPRRARISHFGVPDDYLFQFALPRLGEAAKGQQPFFATLLTISNHPPYAVPPSFKARSTKAEEQVVEYADDCLRNFFMQARQQPWYSNTLFVLVGDHGKRLGETRYEVSESFNHVPLIIFGPGVEPQLRTDFCCQIDIMPTVLHLLGLPYTNESFGIDLLAERRPAAFYSADAVVCAHDSAALYIYNPEAEREFLYDVSTPAFHPLAAHTARTRQLRRYVLANLQAAEAMTRGKAQP